MAEHVISVTRWSQCPYRQQAGRTLCLDVYGPRREDESLRPLVVWIHGGGWALGSKGGPPLTSEEPARTTVSVPEFAWIGEGPANPAPLWLTHYGFIVASIDYSLSDVATFPTPVEDCKEAVRWLRAHAADYGADPDRIGVFGGSAGGYLAAMLGTTGGVESFESGGYREYSSRVQAVCSGAGPIDLSLRVQRSGESVVLLRDYKEAFLGASVDDVERVSKANPVTWVSGDEPPFLLLHGDRDTQVDLENSRQLHHALYSAGVTTTLHVVKGRGHEYFGPENDERVARFFVEHLSCGEHT